MSRGRYHRGGFGPPAHWQPRSIGDAAPTGYRAPGPMFRGYPPRPPWDSNSFGGPSAYYQPRPQYYHAKRPRYNQFHSYPKRPRYQNNAGDDRDDAFYDRYMLEDPWRELLCTDKNSTDNTSFADLKSDGDPSAPSAAVPDHSPKNDSLMRINPPSTAGLQADESTSSGLSTVANEEDSSLPSCKELISNDLVHPGSVLVNQTPPTVKCITSGSPVGECASSEYRSSAVCGSSEHSCVEHLDNSGSTVSSDQT